MPRPLGRPAGQKNHAKWTTVCENCKEVFIASRSDAKTCSVRCRVALHNRNWKIRTGYIDGRRKKG